MVTRWSRLDQPSYSTLGPVSAWMGYRLRAFKLSGYVTRSTQPGHPFVGRRNEYQLSELTRPRLVRSIHTCAVVIHQSRTIQSCAKNPSLQPSFHQPLRTICFKSELTYLLTLVTVRCCASVYCEYEYVYVVCAFVQQ